MLVALLSLPFAVLPAPYHDPAFGPACEFLSFGEGERPPWHVITRDPLCVEYAKQDITFDNGGAARFLLAEPMRIAVAVPACRYWQRDHWSVQVSRGTPPLVAWDGSYWFDKRSGRAAAHVRNFRIGGEPTTVDGAVAAVRGYSPELADALVRLDAGISIPLPPSLFCR